MGVVAHREVLVELVFLAVAVRVHREVLAEVRQGHVAASPGASLGASLGASPYQEEHHNLVDWTQHSNQFTKRNVNAYQVAFPSWGDGVAFPSLAASYLQSDG